MKLGIFFFYIAMIKLSDILRDKYPKKKKLIENIFGVVLIILPLVLFTLFITIKFIMQYLT